MNQISCLNWLPHLQKCKFPVAITYFLLHCSVFVKCCRDIVKTMSAVAENVNWKQGNTLQSDRIKKNNKRAENGSFIDGVGGSFKSHTLQRSRCLTRTNWVSADIYPYELKAKCWVYLWKQTGPYISPGITEISCINICSFCCSLQPPTSALGADMR